MKKIKYLLLLISISMTSLFYWLHHEANPKREGTLSLPGLSAAVAVQFDEFGVPHIEAKNEEDAYHSLGYLMAQDRLFQMDILRRLAKGQLSEIVGEKALEIDKFHRELQLFRKMAEVYRKHKHLLSPQLLNLVQKYLEGLNYYIESRILPLEFHLLRYKPEKFSIEDMYAFVAYMSFTFSEGIKSDSLFEDLFHELPQEKWKELLAPYPLKDSPAILETRSMLGQGGSKPKENSRPTRHISLNYEWMNSISRSITGKLPTFMGSNSAVLSGSKNTTGKPVLLNDPHIGFSNPSVWYEAHIITPNLNLYGHYLAYIPFAVLGETENHAWALTMSEVDDLDLYLESLDSGGENIISYTDTYPLKRHKEVIPVKNSEPVEIEVLSSRNGPILKNSVKTDEQHLVSMKWGVYRENNFVLQAFYEMARAKDIEQFQAAINKSQGPGLNISYVDKYDNIAWFIMGAIPKRPVGRDGNRIFNAQDPNDAYTGYYSPNEKPFLINPPSGIITTANNQSSPLEQHSFNGYFQDPDRARRLKDIWSVNKVWNPDELKEIHNDSVAPFAKIELDFLLEHLDETRRSKHSDILKLLIEWNGEFKSNLPAPLIFETWKRQIAWEALEDELGKERFISFFSLGKFTHFMHFLLRSPESSWWDKTTTESLETPKEIISLALSKSIQILEQKLGKNWNEWEWGKLHQLTLVHPLGRAKPLNMIFNLGPYPVDGNRGIINAMSAKKWDEPYAVTSGPSTRRLVFMSQSDYSWGIIPSGNSGHVFDPHHSDQAELYIKGKYRKQYLNPNLAESNSPYGRLELVVKEN